MKKENVIVNKSYKFAVRIIKLYKYLVDDKKEYVISKQILRSGTSIGANINEAQSAESNSDFIHKFSISAKEIRETAYWLNLLKDTLFIDEKSFNSIKKDCDEILKIINSILLTTRENKIGKQ
ncbi:MAG: CHP02436-containing protein [Ignavibacteria bacterium]|nr:CHP02436-containing protein [Ignavibacteria bacterium]